MLHLQYRIVDLRSIAPVIPCESRLPRRSFMRRQEGFRRVTAKCRSVNGGTRRGESRTRGSVSLRCQLRFGTVFSIVISDFAKSFSFSIFKRYFLRMDATTHPHGTPETDHHDEHGHEHHELGFWRKYIFSTDHKVIGIQYGISGLLFFFFGFCLMMMMHWQLAYTVQAMPLIGNAL